MIGPNGKLIEPKPDTYATRDMVERIFHGESLSNGKQDILQTVFSLAAVLPSIINGLIPLKELTVSGDGTAVKAHANPFGHNPQSLKSIPEDTCTENFRHYSDPDASWGWDSHEKHWYFGRTLYMLVCHNSELSLEVPHHFQTTGIVDLFLEILTIHSVIVIHSHLYKVLRNCKEIK